MTVGSRAHKWAQDLFPITRSITGNGVRETLRYIQGLLPGLEIQGIPSGTRVFDWQVPDEWNISDAYIEDQSGNRIVDFREHNLHVLNYSEPVDRWMDIDELQDHLHSLPDLPDAIPYVTSYYRRRWGFCLTQRQRDALTGGPVRAYIDSELKPGVLNYGELLLKGRSEREVFLSTYICHPSMANNELSGPVVTAAIVQWLASLPQRNYSYRVVFVPETIGSLVYLSRHLDHLKAHVEAGFNVTCVGDERCYSYLPSRDGNTRSDRVAQHVLKHTDPDFRRYTWLDRGSDERQYCAPGVDLPIATIMRSKYGTYPEYHTSLDDLSLVTPQGLEGGFLALRRAIETIEGDVIPKVTVYGEPQLGRRGLYPTLSARDSGAAVRTMMNLLSYSDGTRTLLDIADIIDTPFWELRPLCEDLAGHGLLILEPLH